MGTALRGGKICVGRRAIAAAAVVILAIVETACSGRTTRAGGLEVILSTDMRVPDAFDTLRLEISQETSPGVFHTWVANDYRIPSETTLPTTVSIAAGSAADQDALIRVTARKGSAPVVLREAQVQIPKDRVAELRLVISASCVGQLKVDGMGNAQTSCTDPTKSCQPSTGVCGPTQVDASTLPSYTPGDALSDASLPAISPDAPTGDDQGAADAAAMDVGGSPDAAIADGAPQEAACAAGCASQLVFTVQPTSTSVNTPMTGFDVVVEDATGAPVTAATMAVTIAIGNNPGGANLLGFTTANAPQGIASFDEVGLDKAGSGYTIVASAPGLASITSAPFDVTAPSFSRIPMGAYGGVAASIAISHGANPVLYAGTPAGVFRSTNGGGTWSLASFGAPGEADRTIVDPRDAATVYVTSIRNDESRGSGGFAFAGKTSNGGLAWKAIGDGRAGSSTGTLVVDPVDSSILYGGTTSELYRSPDKGESWSATNFNASCDLLAIDPVTPTTLYAYTISTSTLSKSIDSGATWAALDITALPSADRSLHEVFALPSGVFVTGGPSHVYRSTDGGATWTPIVVTGGGGSAMVYAESLVSRVYFATPAETEGSVQVSNDGGASFGAPVTVGEGLVNDLAVDPSDADRVYAATDSGVYVSADGGATWSSSSIGILTMDIRALSLSPKDANTLLASGPAGVFRTTDAGVTWSRVTVGASTAPDWLRAFAVDPADATKVYAVSFEGNFYESADGGGTWDSGVSTGAGYIDNGNAIAQHGQSFWIPTIDGGVRRSTDGGATWSATSLTAATYGLAVDSSGNVLYAGTNQGTFKSVDGGTTWTSMVAGDLAEVMLVDPTAPATVYAGMGCETSTASTASSNGGVKRSIDSGATWSFVLMELTCIDSMVALPGGMFFAAGGGGSTIVRSGGGTNWTGSGDGVYKSVAAVAATNDGQTIYAGTPVGLYRSLNGGI